VLTERTAVIIYGALDCTDRYQEVMYRGLDWERFLSRPFQLKLWTAYRAKYGCIDVLDMAHDSSGNSHRTADAA
jgi:hypothetical protein